MTDKMVLKVTAYITRWCEGKKQLLVFLEEGYEHLGLQVPGGTVEPGEELTAAVRREVLEESGISSVANMVLLGEHAYESKNGGHLHRFYYEMEAQHHDSFTWVVQSNDEDNGWMYHYRWVNLDDRPVLYGFLGVYIDAILEASKGAGHAAVREGNL